MPTFSEMLDELAARLRRQIGAVRRTGDLDGAYPRILKLLEADSTDELGCVNRRTCRLTPQFSNRRSSDVGCGSSTVCCTPFPTKRLSVNARAWRLAKHL
jgi:hypothetical protein